MPMPDAPLAIEAARERWRAYFAGHVIADTAGALIVREPGREAVVYFPREDVSTEYMSRTDRSTRCPLKGEAAYYSVLMDGQWAENGVWTYEQPLEGAAPLAGFLAFDPEQIRVYAVDDAQVNPHHYEEAAQPTPGEVVRHTDSGSGHSQAEAWTPAFGAPGDSEGGLR